jgi:lia operon protein LiaG
MKINILVAFYMVLPVVSAFCGGSLELVNTQEIGLDQVYGIEVLYQSEKVALFKGTENTLIVKEYMNKNNSNYYAKITNAGNKLTIESGRRPWGLFYTAPARVEIYLPVSYTNALSIKTASGKIEFPDEYACSQINIESSSGSISVNTITVETANFMNSSGSIHGKKVNGNINISTSSGNIDFDHIAGNVSAESSSGSIKLNLVNGGVNAKNSSGSIRCAVNENVGNISLVTTSGSVGLNLPKELNFSFFSKTSSGSLSTPFSDKLFSPITDKKLVEGVVGEDTISENSPQINIRTSSGPINVGWIN